MGCYCAKIHAPEIDCARCKESGWATPYKFDWARNFPNEPHRKDVLAELKQYNKKIK
jgi:hypothetical protein